MCKTRFGSQGVILDGVLKKIKKKNLMTPKTPPLPVNGKVTEYDLFF